MQFCDLFSYNKNLFSTQNLKIEPKTAVVVGDFCLI